MNNKIVFILFLFVVIIFSGCISQTSESVESIKISSNNFLTDRSGMTLYLFTKDELGISNCEGGCLVNWPVFYVEKIEVASGLKAEDFDTIVNSEGSKQTTYKSIPLYYYIKDSKPGDTTGDGVGGVWFLVEP
jgi:predicted lipoprotein with Yx(FWY)xxD motif